MPATDTRTSLVPARPAVGTAAGLRAALRDIDAQGWQSRSGSEVLLYARDQIVDPTIARMRLAGHDAAQARAAGWAEAWETLRRPGTRDAASPWGVVHAAVRGAIVLEREAARYGRSRSSSWRLARCRNRAMTEGSIDGQILGPQLSLEDLAAQGWEPAAAVNPQPELGPRLQVIADALVSVGWQRDQVDALLEWIASRAGRTPGVQRRHLLFDEIATHLQVSPWRVRRTYDLITGRGQTPSLFQQVVLDGPHIINTPETRWQLRRTVQRQPPPPTACTRSASRRLDSIGVR